MDNGMETTKNPETGGKTPKGKKNAKLHLWVWENVLADYSPGIAFAYAETEKKAWDILKGIDFGAWMRLRGSPSDGVRDSRTPEQLDKNCSVRPKKVTFRYAKTVWGGG